MKFAKQKLEGEMCSHIILTPKESKIMVAIILDQVPKKLARELVEDKVLEEIKPEDLTSFLNSLMGALS